jgi:SAM-dependent methyltransferase
MRSSGESWEAIFRRDGYVFPEPFERFAELVEALRKHGCRTILDVGCGTGRHVVALARCGFHVCGLDYAPTGLRLARKWLAEESLAASLVLSDARRPLPFGAGTFDGLVSTQVIHHAPLATVRETISELRRVLRAGGLLFLTVPARPDEDVLHDEIEPGTYVPRSGTEQGVPHHIFSPHELRSELSGFRLLDLSLRGSVVLAFLGVKEETGDPTTR